jgi:outer membrane protein assembly factor BamD
MGASGMRKGPSYQMQPRHIPSVIQHRSAPFLRLAALLTVGVMLGACGSLFKKEDATPVDIPADKLYNEGVYILNQRQNYVDAARKFEEVERQHPYSDWARKSLIMTAYSKYEAKEYDDAIAAAKRYVTLHPGSPDAAYAQYLIGASYFDQIPDITRDQGRTDKAIAALDEVMRKFPDSEYAASAKQKLEFARDQLAGKEMQVGRYYLERKQLTGAINRFKIVVTHYQTTRHVEEALLRLTEAYMTLGIIGEAQTAAAVLGHNFPESRWYAEAYRLVRSRGVEPAENPASWISKAFKKIGGIIG